MWFSALMTTASFACGGFACSLVNPVTQEAERIVFAIDEDNNKVETHVQVSYTGPAEDFAWVIPTPGVPELFISSEALFTGLEQATNPRFNLQREQIGDCADPAGGTDTGPFGGFGAGVGNTAAGGGRGGGVVVVQTEVVGAYETVVLQADDGGELLTWLIDNDYAVTDEFEPALQPYLASGSYFLALKLSKGSSRGDLEPIGMRYAGNAPVVPIQLTRVAAEPDMRLRIWVLGDARAVPTNYLHVQINEAAVDWFSAGSNYDQLVTRAANEAGGHAFATDAAMPPNEQWVFIPSLTELDLLTDGRTFNSLRSLLQPTGWQFVAGFNSVLESCVDLPPEAEDRQLTAATLFSCTACNPRIRELIEVDASACREGWLELVEPMAHARELLGQHEMVTRLVSSMSPAEMTSDPIFTLNPDLPGVDNAHTAVLRTHCESGDPIDHAPRTLELPSGIMVPIPEARFGAQAYQDWLAKAGRRAAWVVEQTGPVGPPTLIADYRSELVEDVGGPTAEETPDPFVRPRPSVEPQPGVAPESCGCSNSSAGGPWLLLAFGLLVRRRV